MASYPAKEKRLCKCTYRYAPMGSKQKCMDGCKPWCRIVLYFLKKPGDKVTISGPYGEFFINHSESEMMYVGGGAGMAPMRSHLYHLFRTLKTGRKVTFWYGGRSRRELFYVDHFRALEKIFRTSGFMLHFPSPRGGQLEGEGQFGR